MIALTPQQIRAAIEAAVVAVIVVLVFWAGFAVQGWRKNSEIADLQLATQQMIGVANMARADAELRATNAEATERARFTEALTTYKETTEHEKALADRTIADLRAGNQRLRVSTTAPRSCPVPGAAAGTSRSDEAGDQTLAPAVAGRLAQRYAEYNELVDRLTLCQAIVKARPSPSAP